MDPKTAKNSFLPPTGRPTNKSTASGRAKRKIHRPKGPVTGRTVPLRPDILASFSPGFHDLADGFFERLGEVPFWIMGTHLPEV